MTADCNEYREQIPKALLGELSSEEQRALELHLPECSPCNQEQALYEETLRQLRSATDVPAPRHFFIHAEERHVNFWQLFLQMTLPWKAAVVAVVLGLGTIAALVTANLEIRAEEGSYRLSFGKPLDPSRAPSPSGVNIEALKTDLLRAMEEKSRRDKVELFRAVRAELDQSNLTLTQGQRDFVHRALFDLENRVNHRIVSSATALEHDTKRFSSDLYQEVAVEHERDLAAITNRLDRIAVNGAIKNNETDVILETLLQVAEMRMK